MDTKLSMATNFIRNFVEAGDTVFDVGANIGQKADLYLAAGAKVICFEPQPDCLTILTEKYQQNPNAFIVNKGLGEQPGTMQLSVCSDANYISTFSQKWKTGRFANYDWNQTVTVEITTLDEMIKLWGCPKFCKIDVEGFEYQVLKGLSVPIPYISFEFAIEFIEDTKNCINHLKSLGYKVFNIAKGEDSNFLFPEWVADSDLLNYLESANDALLWGDIYAKFEGDRHNISEIKTVPKITNQIAATVGYLDLQKLCQQYSIAPRGIIHIGAHEGQEMQEYQVMGADKVLFVEANPSVFERLKLHIAGIPNVWLANCAISNQNGTVNLRVNSHDMSSSILPLKLHKEIYPGMLEVDQVTVTSKTLDSLMQESPLNSSEFNILVIDIQGAELLALQGARETLKYIDAISTEVNCEELYEGCALIDQVDDFLKVYGFQRVAVATPSHPSWGDAFYVKSTVSLADTDNLNLKTSQANNKNSVAIATSIAPGNIENQRAAIESWILLGFEAVSLNSREEISQLQSIYENVTFHEVKRDARADAGRPLVYLDDLFAYLCDRGTSICGIVNSDIRLKADGDLISFICKQAENAVVFGSRTDVDSPEQAAGEIYAKGFDFFFFDKDLLRQFPKSQFCLGLPWWDLWIPLIAQQKGLTVKYVESAIAYHIKHPVNYINDFWQKMGIHFTGFFQPNLSRNFQEMLSKNPNQLQAELTSVAVQAGQIIDKNQQRIRYEVSDKINLEWHTPVKPQADVQLVLQREFWNVDSMHEAMFRRVFIDDTINEMSPDEKINAWNQSAIDSVQQILKSIPTKPEWKILEIGCGVGRIIKPLREMFAQVDGVDISENMIQFAKQYLADGKQNGQVYVNNGSDLQELPSEHYDCVYSIIVFQHIRSISVVKSYFREILRVLKPSGYFRIQVYDTSNPNFGKFDEEAVGEEAYGFFGNAYTDEQLRALLIEQGFDVVSIERESPWLWATVQKAEQNLVYKATVDRSHFVSSAFTVSAIVSTYNSEKFMRGCLQDLVEQTLYKQGALEIIVIDSGSQENEQAIVREFQAKYANIVYDRTSDRETLYAAWNRGIKMSRGAYMTNANTDDRHRPDALEILAKYLDENATVSLVYADQLITATTNDTFANTQSEKCWNWPAFDYSELERRCIIGPQPMWRKSLHEKHGYFRAEFMAAGDYEFWLRIGKTENIVHLPEILGLYCENQQGLQYSSSTSQQETRQIWNEYGISQRGIRPIPSVPVSISISELNALGYRIGTQPLVSIIIPCYNHATLLREAVESVASQTYQNWECIIVNDGSSDDTSNFANYLIQLYPQKSLRLIDKPNTGPADSRNVGVQQSSGKFILFLDADDKLHPKFIEECVEILLAKPQVGFVYTDVQHFGANCDLVTHGDFDANRFLRDNQAPATSLFRREIYEQVGGLKKVMKLGCEDWEFWVSAYEKGWLGDRLPKPYLYYRQHSDGSSRTQKMAAERAKLDLMRATIINLHSQLYKPEEVYWSQHILQQHGNLIADQLVQFNPEQFLTSLSQYVGEYQKDQANQVSLANIRQCRQQLANYWLNLPAEQLPNTYASDLGKAHQILLHSNIKDESLTDTEKTLIDRLTAHISQGIKTPKDINYLLAAALYRRADQLLLNYENAAIPNWFINDYLKFMFAAPMLFQEIGEADNYCRYVQGWISYLHRNIFTNQNSKVWQDIAWFFTQSANFIPLYFNSENLKDIYTKRADIIEYAMKNRGAAIDCIFPARPANRQKIRLGVLTKHFGAMTETFATLPAFEHLNREQFEIILYAINLDGNKLEQYCQSRADRLVKLSNDLPSQVQTIRADDLDILLIATNITAVTHPISLLALHRLARVQTTCFNSPITTGMRHIDYYIAGKLMEPTPNGQEHYREQLATIEGPGCCFSYTLEPYTPSIKLTRNSIGISEESVVFVSTANLYKLVPELRETWAKIMAAVPNSVLFLMPFGPSWTNHYPSGAFVNNMKAVFAKYGVDSKRLRVLNSLPNRADVKEVLKLADVYLDSYPYAGTTSLVDPLEVGLPTVVRDGDTLRSRMGAAVIRSLLMPDLITNSEASYIQLAVNLATNPQLRQRYRQEIQQKMQANPVCFDSVAYSGAIAQLFQQLFHKWQTGHQAASRILQDSIPKMVDLGDRLSNTLKLYQTNPSNTSAISQLRQIRKETADFWLNVSPDNLETIYKGDSGKNYKTLLASGFQHQPMMEDEQRFLQQLTQISKGLVHPQAINALLAAMLYFPPGTMRIPEARNRLPQWLIGDYEQVFEPENAVNSVSSSELLAQYIQSPQFVNQLLGCVNLYRIDSSDESVVLELRQLRRQLADFWLTIPPEKLATFYQGEVRKGYQAILGCGLQAEPMTEAEQQFLQQLTDISKGLVQPQAINALLGAMLYFVPGTMRVPDANTRLPQWLFDDYEKVFESAFAQTEESMIKQDYLPQFINQLTAGVNLYKIDPTAELVVADLRQIRQQISDLWVSVSEEQVEVLYRSDFGKGYKAMLASGFINEPLNESERAVFNSLVAELSQGFGRPKAVNYLLAAMLFCRAGQLRVEDANSCLPSWLLADYEQFVRGAIPVAVK